MGVLAHNCVAYCWSAGSLQATQLNTNVTTIILHKFRNDSAHICSTASALNHRSFHCASTQRRFEPSHSNIYHTILMWPSSVAQSWYEFSSDMFSFGHHKSYAFQAFKLAAIFVVLVCGPLTFFHIPIPSIIVRVDFCHVHEMNNCSWIWYYHFVIYKIVYFLPSAIGLFSDCALS